MIVSFRVLIASFFLPILASAQPGPYNVATFAGIGRPTGDGGPSSAALLNSPRGIVTDSAGNTFFCDQENHRIRKIDKAGKISTVAGNGVRGNSGDGGPAVNAQFIDPYGIALDRSGNLFITDFQAAVVRRVSASDGTISTIAGTGTAGYTGDNGLSTAAELNSPYAVAVDASGNVFIADTGNNRIRKVTPTGAITTVVGNGNLVYSPSGGPGTQISVAYPEGLAFDAAGNLYISEWGYDRILKMTPSGAVSVFAGNGYTGYSGDSGPAVSAMFDGPQGLAVDAAGNLYIADSDNNRIRKIIGSIVTTVAGSGTLGFGGDGFSAGGAQLSGPFGVAIDLSGNLLISDTGNQRIRSVNTLSNLISTIAGGLPNIADGGPATSALLFAPAGLAVDAALNVYIADQLNNRIRKVTPAGLISTVAGTGSSGFSGDGGQATAAQLNTPLGVSLDPQGNLLITDTGNNRIRRVGSNGVIQTIAGNGRDAFAGDGGLATLAALSGPTTARTDAAGNIYIADTFNNRIRKVTLAGSINTLAGSSGSQLGDGGPALTASLAFPSSVLADAAGNVLIADTFNSRIRKVTPNGIITTIAGNGNPGFSGDGGSALAATFLFPEDLALDSAGNLFVQDTGNARIRVVASSGNISTVAGNGKYSDSGDGGPALQASLGFLGGIALDSNGIIYFSDSDNSRVRDLIRPAVVSDFSLSADSQTLSLPAGGSAVVTLTLLSSGFGGPVTLGFKNFNAGSVTFSPSAPVSLTAGQSVPVKASASIAATAVPGQYTLILTADSGSLHHELTITVNLTAASPAGPVLSPGGIVNAAGYTAGAVSPGEIVTIFGSGIGPAVLAPLQLNADGNVASTLAGVTVLFDQTPAPLLYVSGTQISAIVPYATAGQSSTQLQVQYQGGTSNVLTVPVTDAVPALFTASSSGTGAAAILNSDSSANSALNPAAQGSIVVLFGTGAGQTVPGGLDGVRATDVYPLPVLPVTVSIGGQNATVLYAGAAPGQVAGLIQMNVVIPAGTPSGAVPVTFTMGTRTSPSGVTVAVQ